MFSGLVLLPKNREGGGEQDGEQKPEPEHCASVDKPKSWRAIPEKRGNRRARRLMIPSYQYAPIAEFAALDGLGAQSPGPMSREADDGDIFGQDSNDDDKNGGDEAVGEEEEDFLRCIDKARIRDRMQPARRSKTTTIRRPGPTMRLDRSTHSAKEQHHAPPLRSKTIGGRVDKTRAIPSNAIHMIKEYGGPNRLAKVMRRHKYVDPGSDLHAIASLGWTPVFKPTESEILWSAISDFPGFAFPLPDAQSALRDDLGLDLLVRILDDPSVIRKCGLSSRRRRIPSFIILMLTFPIRAHHGRGTFERDCGYLPGDEHNPAFWARFADAFAAWLDLGMRSNDDNDTASQNLNRKDPFDGGVLLQRLVTFLSSARTQFLDQHRNNAQPEAAIHTPRAQQAAIGDEDFMMEENGNEDHSDDNNKSARGMDEQQKRKQPTQLQRRVSVATDAWLLFLERSQNADFDPEMLADLSIY